MRSNLPLIQQAGSHNSRIAIIDEHGQYTYSEILTAAGKIASLLRNGKDDLQETRVAFMAPPGFEYVAVQWGIWLAGGIAVPLCLSHPLPEIEYVLQDTDAAILIAHSKFRKKLLSLCEKRNIRFVLTTEAIKASPMPLPQIDTDRRAMILYTSGTTSKPKGAVLTHQNITAQITCLIAAWGWNSDDHILHVLPLHHTHGIINALSCALWAGATCEMLPKFDADEIWNRFISGNATLFMAVPTIYVKLISAWENVAPERQKAMSQACAKMRLMVSGSAALPRNVFEKWQAISGHSLLERYGMTEVGMALSNPLHGERRPGAVGTPLPGVHVKLIDETGAEIVEEGKPGEIHIKGPNVFIEYWQKPEATQNAFTEDGWFRTGDMAVREGGYFRILGRSSVDIIKTGGYKVSALEIEEVLRTHPGIRECAVVGLPDEEWGERVCAVVVTKNNTTIAFDDLRIWAKERLASYKIPTRLLTVDALPRNVMDKVTKPVVKRLFEKFQSNSNQEKSSPENTELRYIVKNT
jgi:malonyl-CoA/methylmalonyl-CoA synthetase